MKLEYKLQYADLVLQMIKRSSNVHLLSLQQPLFRNSKLVAKLIEDQIDENEELLNYFEKPLLEEQMLRDRWGEQA